MIDIHTVEEQLEEIGCNFRFFGRPEVKELTKILHEGEKIVHATNGLYEGGVALLVVTDQRLLLIDKKPMFLTIEDVRFDMIAEIDFNYRLLNSTARIFSTNKTVSFTSWSPSKLRTLVQYLQHQVMILRHQHASAVGEHIHNRLQEQFAQIKQQPATHFIPAVATPMQQGEAVVTQNYREQTPEVVPSLAYVALQASPSTNSVPASNPYSHRLPALSRRRKFPSFY